MQISIRSYLTAGTAAVVGATAVAMTPVAAGHLNLPAVQLPSVAEVALAGFDSPITELLDTLGIASNYLFNGFGDPADPAEWATGNVGALIAGGLTTINPLVPWTPVYSNVGLLPQIITDALPIISQLGYNGSEYLQATASSLYLAGRVLSEGIWNLPENVIDAVQASDLDALIGAFIDPFLQAGSILLNAGGYVLTGVVQRASAVFETIVDLVPTLFEVTLGQIQVAVDSVGTVFNNFIDAFGTANPIENAWNAVVDGLLGPLGVPGTLVNLTIGMGVQTGPTPDTFVPSIRTSVQTGVKAIANALATPVVTPNAAVRTAAPAAAAVAAVEAVEAPAVEVSAADVKAEATAPVEAVEAAPAAEAAPAGDTGGATAGDSAPAEKPVAKQRVSRKAANN